MVSPSPSSSLPRAVRAAGPAIVAALALLGFYAVAIRGERPLLTGDEPQYLAFARSLTQGSFDVRAAYTDRDGPSHWLPGLPTDQTVTVGGHVRPIRLPLLPLLLAPAMAASSLTLVRLTMIALAVAFLDQLWRLLGELGYRGWARAGPWLIALTALPVLGFATLVYPEVPGALVVVIALRLMHRGTRAALIGVSAMAALLPWLIIRFAWLGVALAAMTVVAARRSRRDMLVVAAPFVASMVLLLLYVRVVYGTFDVRATYPARFTQPWTFAHAYEIGFGSLLGATEGLVPYAPAFLLALAAAVAAARRFGAAGWCLLGIAAVHVFVVVPTGFYGAAPPGRFAIVLVPLLALAVAEAVRRVPPLGYAVVGLAVLQLVIVGLYTSVNSLIVDREHKHVYVAMFPTVDPEPGVESFGLRPAADGLVEPGGVYRSPPLDLRHGPYTARVQLHPGPARGGIAPSVATVDVVQIPRHRTLASEALPSRAVAQPVVLSFSVPNQSVLRDDRVVFTVRNSGTASLAVESLSGAPSAPLPSRNRVIRADLPLAALWVGLVAVAGWLLARRRDEDEVTS